MELVEIGTYYGTDAVDFSAETAGVEFVAWESEKNFVAWTGG